MSSFTPGVGTYNVDMGKPSSPTYSFNKQKFNHSMSVDKSGIFISPEQTPGPGRYNAIRSINSTHCKSPSYSIKGKPNNPLKDKTPGPGQYNNNKSSFDLTNSLNVAASFSKTQRSFNPCLSPDGQRVDDRLNSPGPGRYNMSMTNRPKTPNYSIPHQGRFNNNFSENPGPGTYYKEIDYITAGGNSYSIGRSKDRDVFSTKNTSQVGPGQYQLDGKFNNKQNAASVKIGTSPRKIHVNNEVPGPGQYEPKIEHVKAKNSGFLISKAKREELFNTSQRENPGPGRYTAKNSEAKGFKFSQAKPVKVKDNFPGPGQYQQESFINKSTTNVVFPKTKREDINKTTVESPGPGRYDNLYNIKKSYYGISFNKDKKFKDMKSENPGPGQYNLPNSIRDFSGVLYQ